MKQFYLPKNENIGINHSESGITKKTTMPKPQTIQNILDFSKAYESRPSVYLKRITQILN